MNEGKANRGQGKPSKKQLKIPYIKSSVAPVLHVDGVFGGVSSPGLIYLAFFSEHPGIPDAATMNLDMVKRTAQQQPQQIGLVRDVVAEIIMTIDLARTLRGWIDERINQSDTPDEATFTIVREEQQS